ncbi:hypothetical protein CkaCkLH20_03908 [Colletotrichum karsti]|uniref:Arrestin-like N-terminal domain-containing protein n=1 Tax=Colletotrichum karsti TaxID=1095194 RepID=A0A9P6LMP8_9PEZI|nr:uncharacterized protein CkaCkLH20_03908 [Colletotrichum karsti]KAF9878416.1 hypothetical protein CkaCkLH20_03908 [Colletotrichum karsti]
MPTTCRKGGPDLSLQLVDPSTPLYPGSVVLGHAVRKSHIVAANATVRVRLQGRAKAKLVVDRGNNSKSYYRSRFNFWSQGAIADVVHNGPVHVAQGPGAEAQSWPFALALPTHTDAGAVNAALTEKEREACFLRAPGDVRGSLGVPEQPLPGSFFFEHSGFGKSWHGFVEYWLEAELVVEGKRKMVEATLPVRVWSVPSPSPPIADFGLVGRTMAGCVSTQRLMPGMEEAKLSFKQKSQKFFGSSKVPTFHYSLRVEYPTRIQLGNPSTIPFRLKLTPDREKSSDVIEDVPQRVIIKSATLEVHSTTAVICPGSFDPHEASKSRKACIGKTNKFINEIDGIVIPSSSKEEPLDLGAVMDLRLNATGSVPDASRFGAGAYLTLAPTYTTYCVQLHHMMKWEIQVLIAGESWECGWQQKIVVLPPVENAMSGGPGQAMATLAVDSPVPAPPPVEEEVPAYDGPSSAAPAYEKVVGGNGEGSSAVNGDTKS